MPVMEKNSREVKHTRLSGNAYAVEAVNRAADILFVFSHAEPELTLAQVVARSGLPKTTAFRVLSTLCDRGLCMQDALSGKYSLGFELLHLADIRRRQATIHGLAMPLLRVIRDQVKETVVLSIRAGDYRVHIDFAEGLHPLREDVNDADISRCSRWRYRHAIMSASSGFVRSVPGPRILPEPSPEPTP